MSCLKENNIAVVDVLNIQDLKTDKLRHYNRYRETILHTCFVLDTQDGNYTPEDYAAPIADIDDFDYRTGNFPEYRDYVFATTYGQYISLAKVPVVV